MEMTGSSCPKRWPGCRLVKNWRCTMCRQRSWSAASGMMALPMAWSHCGRGCSSCSSWRSGELLSCKGHDSRPVCTSVCSFGKMKHSIDVEGSDAPFSRHGAVLPATDTEVFCTGDDPLGGLP